MPLSQAIAMIVLRLWAAAVFTYQIVGLLALAILISLTLYLVSFPVYALVRSYSLYLDKLRYREITGTNWTVRWARDQPAEVASEMAAAKP